MLHSLFLNNFRSWKKSTIEFCPGVNVITGENDSGKTNILRGINWVANNRPAGEDIRSYWGGDSISRLTVRDGNISKFVERIRSDSDNLYKIEGQREPLRSFGQSVPETVSKILNLSSINIQFQLDGPFLLGKSSSDVAKYYNDAVNLEIIDRSISNISKTLRIEKSELSKLKTDQKNQIEKLKAFDWLPEAEAKLVSLEKMKTKIIRLESEYVLLDSLAKNLKELKDTHDKLNEIVKHEKTAIDLLKLDEQIEIKTDEYNELESSISQLQSLKKQSEKFQIILQYEVKTNDLIQLLNQIEIKRKEFQELETPKNELIELNLKAAKYTEVLKFETALNALVELDKKIDTKINEYNELFDLVKRREAQNLQFEDIDKQRIKFETEFTELMPDICPLCGK